MCTSLHSIAPEEVNDSRTVAPVRSTCQDWMQRQPISDEEIRLGIDPSPLTVPLGLPG